jgi:tetratricopeptide (TPR) repeat protein
MKAWLVFAVCLLAGCASQPLPPPPTAGLFDDKAFIPPTENIDARQVMALSDEMRRYVHEDIRRQLKETGKQRGLFNALFRTGQLKLEYDTTMTRNAAQAFHARAGNCLSLVLMTAALAKELDLTVSYQSVYADEIWSRKNDLYFASGHVNIALGKKRTVSIDNAFDSTAIFIVDFLPPGEAATLRSQTIEENTVIAMYMNNRAAESLAADKVDDAYWWASAAMKEDARFLPAYNTLGVIYLRHHQFEQAARVLDAVLKSNPDNTLVMYNLVQALNDLGRTSEAGQLNAKLQALRAYTPFYYFNLGKLAMGRGDYVAARDLLLREIDHMPDFHESHFLLAQVYFKLGDYKQADHELELAQQSSTVKGEQDLYAAKRASMKAYMH